MPPINGGFTGIGPPLTHDARFVVAPKIDAGMIDFARFGAEPGRQGERAQAARVADVRRVGEHRNARAVTERDRSHGHGKNALQGDRQRRRFCHFGTRRGRISRSNVTRNAARGGARLRRRSTRAGFRAGPSATSSERREYDEQCASHFARVMVHRAPLVAASSVNNK